MSKEIAVRDAAAALLTAIVEARDSGLTVEWPGRAEDLSAIAISATGKAVETEPAPAKRPKV